MCTCHTRYPILLIHGTGFRDRKYFGYWGRIPRSLERQGAAIFYGNQDSWGTIENNGEVIRRNLRNYVEESRCGKVNIIAHSKGGLEARYLVSALDCGPLVASITTVSTPHHGSVLMDRILKLPSWLMRAASVFLNLWFRLLGDEKPDFYHVCRQLSTEHMAQFNLLYPDAEGIYYQSFATAMKNPLSDVFMAVPNFLVGLTEGKNDGLVAVTSAVWTNFGGVWERNGLRGISHADSIDFRRRPFGGRRDGEIVDICDCYIDIVGKLKRDGY